MSYERLLGFYTAHTHQRGLTFRLCSSFYGLLDILSGTELNSGQREIGKYFRRNAAPFLLTSGFSSDSQAVL